MKLAQMPLPRIVTRLALADLAYVVVLLIVMNVAKGTRLEAAISQWVVVAYFAVPALVSLLVLWLAGALSLRDGSLRPVGLIAWAVILPGFVFWFVLIAAMWICRTGWVSYCTAY